VEFDALQVHRELRGLDRPNVDGVIAVRLKAEASRLDALVPQDEMQAFLLQGSVLCV
jgi:hypothetical protein